MLAMFYHFVHFQTCMSAHIYDIESSYFALSAHLLLLLRLWVAVRLILRVIEQFLSCWRWQQTHPQRLGAFLSFGGCPFDWDFGGWGTWGKMERGTGGRTWFEQQRHSSANINIEHLILAKTNATHNLYSAKCCKITPN